LFQVFFALLFVIVVPTKDAVVEYFGLMLANFVFVTHMTAMVVAFTISPKYSTTASLVATTMTNSNIKKT
jgi:hypothetical protein